jgi:hypothetical protein
MVLVVSAGASAETFKLDLKRLEDRTELSPSHRLYRATESQHFYMDPRRGGNQRGLPTFSDLVKKEPAKYECDKAFRFVVPLGSDYFACVLDASKPEAEGYDLLYFDGNHNGDLTDDGVVKARSFSASSRRYWYTCGFPRVDVAIRVEDQRLEYAFILTSHLYDREVYASLQAGAYREGEITLCGKRHRIVVLDYNANGRFDDKIRIDNRWQPPEDGVWATMGDVVFVDPDTTMTSSRIGRRDRQSASELISIDDRFYELQISPAGDAITLTPSGLPTGMVAFDHGWSQAVLYGEHGFVKITAGKSKTVPVPVGDWRLLTYGIDLAPLAQEVTARSASAYQARPTILWARGTSNTSTLRVERGKTTPVPFGPPYRPVVKPSQSQEDWVWLSLRLMGRAGEVCEDLYVDGDRPSPPTFTITGPNRKVVARGNFKYG